MLFGVLLTLDVPAEYQRPVRGGNQELAPGLARLERDGDPLLRKYSNSNGGSMQSDQACGAAKAQSSKARIGQEPSSKSAEQHNADQQMCRATPGAHGRVRVPRHACIHACLRVHTRCTAHAAACSPHVPCIYAAANSCLAALCNSNHGPMVRFGQKSRPSHGTMTERTRSLGNSSKGGA